MSSVWAWSAVLLFTAGNLAAQGRAAERPSPLELPPSEPGLPTAEESPQASLEGTPQQQTAEGEPGEGPTIGQEPDEPPLTPELVALRDKVRRCLALYHSRPINAADMSSWGIMHAMIAYGVDTEIYAGNRKVNAVSWLCWNGPCRGHRLLSTQQGRLRAHVGPGVQGHPAQFLAILAQARIQPDYPLHADGHQFTVADLIQYEKQTCDSRTELTFKLIALAHYLKASDESWTNQRGERWNIQRLIREEMAQSVHEGACGGTHRMMSFSFAVRKRQRHGGALTGEWARAKQFVDDYHDYALRMQNRDGSFSTNWFAGRGDWGDAPLRLETTGHILEWLAFSLPQKQLDDPRVVRAVDYLASLLLDSQHWHSQWEIGPLGHALHGLAIYDERRFGSKPGQRALILAQEPRKQQRE